MIPNEVCVFVDTNDKILKATVTILMEETLIICFNLDFNLSRGIVVKRAEKSEDFILLTE